MFYNFSYKENTLVLARQEKRILVKSIKASNIKIFKNQTLKWILICIFVYVLMCASSMVHTGIHVCMNVCEGQRLRFNVFLSHSSCFLKQGLSLNLELANLNILSAQWAPGSLSLPLQNWGYRYMLYAWLFIVVTGRGGGWTWVLMFVQESLSLIEPTPQPQYWFFKCNETATETPCSIKGALLL